MVTTTEHIDTAALAPDAFRQDPDLTDADYDAADEAVGVESHAVGLAAMLGEFDDVDRVYAAAKAVREAGFTRFDVHSPFPIHGIDKAIGIKPTILPWIVLGGGLTGMAAGTFLTIWTMATSQTWAGLLQGYPYLISGKPSISFPAFIPPIFELTILLAAFGAVFGMLLLNTLPMLYNPLLKSERFRRVTDDRFFVVIDAHDPKFDADAAESLLHDCGAIATERVED